MKKGIIFDLDGTLWDSSEQLVAPWNAVARRYGEKRVLTGEDIRAVMGKTADEIGQLLMPSVPSEMRGQIVRECCSEELSYLKRTGGILFPCLRETLNSLREMGYLLAVVSNCESGYIEVFMDYHGLAKFFDDYECIGNTRLPKADNIRLIVERNRIDKAVYVGDTQGDCDSADKAGVKFIYAAYGFGRVSGDRPYISQFCELPQRAEQVLA